MAYLQCSRYRLNICHGVSPVIDPERDLYYALGGDEQLNINCQACGEARGWHLLRDQALLDRIQRRPTYAVEEREEPTPPDDAGMVPDIPVSASELQHYLETAPARQLMAPETLRRMAELLCAMLAPVSNHQIHTVLRLLRWWPKLCDLEWPAPLRHSYNERIALFLADIEVALHRQPHCFHCGRHYRECVGDLVAHSAMEALLSAENGALCGALLRRCDGREPVTAPIDGPVPWWQRRPRDESTCTKNA